MQNDRLEADPTDGEEMSRSNRLVRRDFLKSGLAAGIGTVAIIGRGTTSEPSPAVKPIATQLFAKTGLGLPVLGMGSSAMGAAPWLSMPQTTAELLFRPSEQPQPRPLAFRRERGTEDSRRMSRACSRSGAPARCAINRFSGDAPAVPTSGKRSLRCKEKGMALSHPFSLILPPADYLGRITASIT